MIAAQVRRGHLTFRLETNIGAGISSSDLAPVFKTDAERLDQFFSYLAANQLIDTDAWVDKKVVYCPKLAELSDQHIERLMRENGADKVRTKNPHRKKKEEYMHCGNSADTSFKIRVCLFVWKQTSQRIQRLRDNIKIIEEMSENLRLDAESSPVDSSRTDGVRELP